MPAAKKSVAKAKPKATPRTRVAQKKNVSFVSRTPKFNLVVVGIVASLVLLAAVVYLFVSQASTARYNALQPVKAGNAAGAKLPINYSLSSLTGTVRYAKPSGSTTSACTASDPCTIARAVSQTTTANSTIVLYGGIYRGEANIQISGSGRDGLRIIAYPGQTPEIRGSVEIASSSGPEWVAEGNFRYRAYVPRPLQNGGGVNFGDLADMTNLSGDGVGRYADQAWIGTTALKQTLNKSSLVDGQFYIDRATNRLYMTANDAAKGGIEISRPGSPTVADRDRLFQILSARVTIEGLKINRYSANANDYGAITLESSASNATILNTELSDMPFEAVHTGLNDNILMKNVTIKNIAWQAVNANQTDNFTFDSVKITDTDPFDEFTSSPASGALKTSRTRGTKILNSAIANNKSHGLWFDQSNINVAVIKNLIKDNYGAGVFFEISDGLTLANNYIAAPASGVGQPVKMAGSSGLRLVNNTIVGGADPLGIYIDSRSGAACAADKSGCLPGVQTWSGDRQGRFATSIGTTMDWMPRIDVMVNNIVAYPRTTSFCSPQAVGLCIMLSHSSGAATTLDKVIHKADATRNIPQTIIDGNVYANGTASIIRDGIKNYTSVGAWTTSLASSPALIAGLDANGKSGNSWVDTDGTPTDALITANTAAYKLPAFTGSNAVINTYVPAGTQQYGALSDVTSIPATTSPTTTTTTTTTPSPTPDATAPTGPSSLSASATSTSQINLSWPAATDNVGVSSYVLTRNGTQIYTGTALSFSDTGLSASTSYTYKVIAKDAVGNPSTGATTTGTTKTAATPSPTPTPTPTADTTKPSQPTNAKGKIEFDGLKFSYFTNLTWSPSYDNIGVTSYEVKRNNASLGTTTTPNFKDYSLEPNILYTYDIYARDAAGNVSVPGTTRLTGRCFLIWCWSE